MESELPPSVGSFEELLSIFSYDRELQLDLEETSIEHRNGIAVHDIRYASLANGVVSAYLVTPPGTGPYPAIVFVHPAPGSRETFLDEALYHAQQGSLSLLIEAPWARGEDWGRTLGQPESDRRAYIEIAIDLQRAVDLLTSLPDVDANRIGYVGHSFGALFGGVLSGIEKRIQAFALMSGTGSFTDVAVLSMPFLQGHALEAYTQAMTRIDPIYYVRRAAPSALYFQFGLQDEAFPREKVVAFAHAGSEPKLVKWYDADHFLNDEARSDRIEWLRTQLGVAETQ